MLKVAVYADITFGYELMNKSRLLRRSRFVYTVGNKKWRKMFEIGAIKIMKQMMVIGILTVLSLTILSACGTTTEANPSQETPDNNI